MQDQLESMNSEKSVMEAYYMDQIRDLTGKSSTPSKAFGSGGINEAKDYANSIRQKSPSPTRANKSQSLNQFYKETYRKRVETYHQYIQ